jgi:hypothetical protein
MKKILVVLLSTLSLYSFTANALEVAATNAPAVLGGLTYIATVFSIVNKCMPFDLKCVSGRKEAALQIIADSQNYAQTGELSLLIAQEISDIQKMDNSLSQDDALDTILATSFEILKND